MVEVALCVNGGSVVAGLVPATSRRCRVGVGLQHRLSLLFLIKM